MRRHAHAICGHLSASPFAALAKDRADLWPTVLEKAWARLHGTYTDIRGGRIADYDAFGAFPLMRFLPHALPGTQTETSEGADALWPKMRDWAARGWPMTAGAAEAAAAKGGASGGGGGGGNGGADGRGNSVDSEGIVSKHAFSLLRVFELGPLRLLQLRNPWGSTGAGTSEWNGKYSDGDHVSWTPELRAATGYDPESADAADDGINWRCPTSSASSSTSPSRPPFGL